MSHFGLPPLDLQTEHLDRSQYPSGRLLLLIAAIMASVLMTAWAADKPPVPPGDVVAAAEHPIDRELAARVIPMRP